MRRNVRPAVRRRVLCWLTLNVVAQVEAPSGLVARGHFEAVSMFVDDESQEHLKFEWSFDITKEWK